MAAATQLVKPSPTPPGRMLHLKEGHTSFICGEAKINLMRIGKSEDYHAYGSPKFQSFGILFEFLRPLSQQRIEWIPYDETKLPPPPEPSHIRQIRAAVVANALSRGYSPMAGVTHPRQFVEKGAFNESVLDAVFGKETASAPLPPAFYAPEIAPETKAVKPSSGKASAK